MQIHFISILALGFSIFLKVHLQRLILLRVSKSRSEKRQKSASEEFRKNQHKSIVFMRGSEAAPSAGRERGWASWWAPRGLSA